MDQAEKGLHAQLDGMPPATTTVKTVEVPARRSARFRRRADVIDKKFVVWHGTAGVRSASCLRPSRQPSTVG